MCANIFGDAGQVPILRYFEACPSSYIQLVKAVYRQRIYYCLVHLSCILHCWLLSYYARIRTLGSSLVPVLIKLSTQYDLIIIIHDSVYFKVWFPIYELLLLQNEHCSLMKIPAILTMVILIGSNVQCSLGSITCINPTSLQRRK